MRTFISWEVIPGVSRSVQQIEIVMERIKFLSLFRHSFCSFFLPFIPLSPFHCLPVTHLSSFCAIPSLSSYYPFVPPALSRNSCTVPPCHHRSCLFITSLSPLFAHSSAPCESHYFSPCLSPLYSLLVAFLFFLSLWRLSHPSISSS